MTKYCRNKKNQDKGKKKENKAHVIKDEIMIDEVSENQLGW